MHGEVLSLVTIPLFTAVIGYVINWTGVLMLFYPVRFRGVHVPGLTGLVSLMPRKIQQVPGVMVGGLGWQGIVPSRAAKMGSIAVDKGISKLASPLDFYEHLEPDEIAKHILATAHRDIEVLVEQIMDREHPQFWRNAPPRARQLVHARIRQQLPDLVHLITTRIGTHIDQLLDVKLMVIGHLEENPELVNRIFLEVGRRELRFIQNFGFVFGLALGVPMAVITQAWPQWWVLPIGGVVIGYITNVAAIRMIFEPAQPHKLGPFTLHGLFVRRQPQAADVYAKIIADEIVTLENIGDELLHGPRSDRTRHLVANVLRPVVDRVAGSVRPLVRVAVGAREYDAIRESVATEAVGQTMVALTDPALSRQRSGAIFSLIGTRMRDMAPTEFAEMLRSAFREDEWLLYLHGAVLGFGAGLLHLAIFG